MRILVFLLCLAAGQLQAQPSRKDADAQYSNEQWAEAAKGYQHYLKKNEKDSSAWYRLAFCQLKMGAYEASLKNFDEAVARNFYPGYTLYTKSKAYALLENQAKTYETLRAALDRGFSNFRLMESEEEWSPFQGDQKFLSLLYACKVNAYPCLSDSVRRHFDFWIGEWEVYVNGSKVGENSITLANGGCAIHESYTTPGTYTGQSINYYDKLDNKWHQTWVGSAGGVLDYVEIDKRPGMIQFQCDYRDQQGNVVKSRLTFTDNGDGTVRQLFENSSDGETWAPGFDGLYKPKSVE